MDPGYAVLRCARTSFRDDEGGAAPREGEGGPDAGRHTRVIPEDEPHGAAVRNLFRDADRVEVPPAEVTESIPDPAASAALGMRSGMTRSRGLSRVQPLRRA